MALLSKKEFAESCGMDTKTLAVYIGRHKVVTISEDQIDDTNPGNMSFRAKMLDKKTGKAPAPAGKKAPERKSGTPKTKQSARPDKSATLLYDLDKEKKQTDIETNRKRNELLAMELAKKAGKLIPTADVKALFAQHSRSITVSFSQFIENFITEIAQAARLNANQRAELRKKMIVMLNKSVDDSVDMTNAHLKNLVDQMALTQKSA